MIFKKIQKVLGVLSLAVAVASVGFSSSAQAAEDEVWWDWDLETTGSDVVWNSGEPFLNPDWGDYFAELEITVAEIDIFGGAVTLDILGLFEGDTSESALIPIQPPFVLYSDTLDFDDGDEDPANDTIVDTMLWVDAAGEGHGSMTNVQLGTFNGNQISRLQLAGTLHIVCVPEPSALALLGCGGFAVIVAVRRRRK